MKVAGIILVAGSSTRFDSKISKQLFNLNNKPVFSYSIDEFNKSNLFDEIIVVCDSKTISKVTEYTIANNINAKVIEGGLERQDSVKNGLNALQDLDDNDIVIIHDGARPLISKDILVNIIEQTIKFDAVTTCLPMEDTIVSSNDDSINQFINRKTTFRVQTPQAFKYSLIKKAHENATSNTATDDCTLVMNLGHQVKLIPGSKKLTKITTIEDIKYLEVLLNDWI